MAVPVQTTSTATIAHVQRHTRELIVTVGNQLLVYTKKTSWKYSIAEKTTRTAIFCSLLLLKIYDVRSMSRTCTPYMFSMSKPRSIPVWRCCMRFIVLWCKSSHVCRYHVNFVFYGNVDGKDKKALNLDWGVAQNLIEHHAQLLM